jgi:hypothetical protein
MVCEKKTVHQGIRMNQRARRLAACLLASLLPLFFSSAPVSAWGDRGHQLINQAAMAKASTGKQGFPSFFTTKQNVAWVIFLGPEPDRWKHDGDVAVRLSEVQNHFLDLENLNGIELPRDRVSALKRYAEKHRAAEEVGCLPYAIMENFDRLKLAFRQYRSEKSAGRNTQPVEQTILYYSGILGHYVADGSQPLHVTVLYDGWKGENPKGYATEKGIHKKFEGDFVDKFMRLDSFRKMVAAPKLVDDPFKTVLSYLQSSFTIFERVYELEKRGEFDQPSAETKTFVAERLALGSQMLLDLWWTAWKTSGDIE